jgi:hypothetical protein
MLKGVRRIRPGTPVPKGPAIDDKAMADASAGVAQALVRRDGKAFPYFWMLPKEQTAKPAGVDASTQTESMTKAANK